jgi:ATP-dependent Clp protease ATP-binding subunit ClpX
MDGVELEFTPEALAAAAERALGHQTGARSLRYIIEDTLLDVMYDLPSLSDVTRCIVDREAIAGVCPPTLLTADGSAVDLPTAPALKSA